MDVIFGFFFLHGPRFFKKKTKNKSGAFFLKKIPGILQKLASAQEVARAGSAGVHIKYVSCPTCLPVFVYVSLCVCASVCRSAREGNPNGGGPASGASAALCSLSSHVARASGTTPSHACILLLI